MSNTSAKYVGSFLEEIRDEARLVSEGVVGIWNVTHKQPTGDEFSELRSLRDAA